MLMARSRVAVYYAVDFVRTDSAYVHKTERRPTARQALPHTVKMFVSLALRRIESQRDLSDLRSHMSARDDALQSCQSSGIRHEAG